LYLAIDQGGHASRAILFADAGRPVAAASVAIRTDHDAAGHIEHDPDELIGSVRGAVDQVCAQSAGHRVCAAGLATQRSSIVCWDRRTGEALSPVISWQDRRNAAWLSGLQSRAAEIREATGLVLSPHYGASKMRWCLENLPAVQRACDAGNLAIGPLSSFVLFRLLRERPFVVDPANASRTQLWDPATRDWSLPLTELFGVPRPVLPRCVTSRHAYGTLETPAGQMPLMVVTGDQSAVPFAFGPLDQRTLYINVGTGAFVQRPILGELPEAPRLLASVIWSEADEVSYTLEGTVNGAGSALEWLAALEHTSVAELLSKLDVPDGRRRKPPIFLNGISGLGAPFWVSDFESRFLGTGSVEDRLLAVIESIAFLIMANVDEFRRHGLPLQRLLLGGGVSTHSRFCQMLATLASMPVWRSRDADTSARGLAYLVAGKPPAWLPAACDRFEPQKDAELLGRHDAWRRAMARALAA
jgi:glycerol kinase